MKYPIGIQDFESLRHDGYVYVDKTAYIHELATTGRYYFLSRPRRFGKSLLLSTMEAFFCGKRELFAGLAIERLEKEWTKYPVLRLDLNSEKYETPASLTNLLNEALLRWESEYGKREEESSLVLRFLGVVRRASEITGRRVVVLIDEYDKPMLQAIGNEALQQEYRSTLKAFYSVLKTNDRYIKFAFLTGVTKFGKVSVFSDLNHLNDISMDACYSNLCGISDEELHEYFDEPVSELASATGISKQQCYDRLRRDFDGYHFEVNTPGVYNPFSLLNTFRKLKFSDYWFETGTPSFLVELLRKTDYRLDMLQKEEVTADVLNSLEAMDDNPVPVIYQSGYLTIKGYDERFGFYRLGFPNEEVEKGFVRYLLPLYTPRERRSEFCVSQFVADVEAGRAESFMERLVAFFDDNDYRVAGKMENYFQNTMYVVFRMMGFYTQVERATSKGRIDLTIQTPAYVYVIEIKLDGSAAAALRQIEEKGYARPFAKDARRLFRIGINFSSETLSIADWKLE